MFKIDLSKIEEVKVCLDNGLVVNIQALGIREEEELRLKNTTGEPRTVIDPVTKKNSIYMPKLNHVEFNIAFAKATWKSWELTDPEGKPLECNDENIDMFFNQHWELAKSVLDKFDSIMLEQKKTLNEEKKT
ncbi:hypothetical protein KAR91_30700 [Candidatus Pacearchaeota archaeon]|nr:hypothetical protein [Candidatus Pacearchaeota archaeon]